VPRYSRNMWKENNDGFSINYTCFDTEGITYDVFSIKYLVLKLAIYIHFCIFFSHIKNIICYAFCIETCVINAESIICYAFCIETCVFNAESIICYAFCIETCVFSAESIMYFCIFFSHITRLSCYFCIFFSHIARLSSYFCSTKRREKVVRSVWYRWNCSHCLNIVLW
jgi:hypothetical protein